MCVGIQPYSFWIPTFINCTFYLYHDKAVRNQHINLDTGNSTHAFVSALYDFPNTGPWGQNCSLGERQDNDWLNKLNIQRMRRTQTFSLCSLWPCLLNDASQKPNKLERKPITALTLDPSWGCANPPSAPNMRILKEYQPCPAAMAANQSKSYFEQALHYFSSQRELSIEASR